jgi:putative addiction module component (TIGR02574 family)
MATASEVLTAARSLSAQQRAEVAHALLLSLEPDDGDADADAAWAAEIRRRLQAIREGTVALRDWDEALEEIRQSIRSQETT